VINNLKLLNNFISFIHTKRYNPNLQDGKKFDDLKINEYDQIFEVLQERESLDSKINITSFEKQPDLDIIRFNLNGDFNSNFNVRLVSLFRPNEEYSFNMGLYNNVNFFITKKNNGWVKDLYLIITHFKGYGNIIKDCVKIN
jgi:hypothetical protein